MIDQVQIGLLTEYQVSQCSSRILGLYLRTLNAIVDLKVEQLGQDSMTIDLRDTIFARDFAKFEVAKRMDELKKETRDLEEADK